MEYKFTIPRRERQKSEHRNHGKYAKFYPCEICDKSAGMDYASLESFGKTTDLGQVICKKCAAKIYKQGLTDEQVIEMIKTRKA